jgi:glutathionyl-hydroquinone reductase
MENNEKYEVQDYDARDLMEHLDKEMNLDEINYLISKLEFEIDFKKYPTLNTFFYIIDKFKQELKTIKKYVNGR